MALNETDPIAPHHAQKVPPIQWVERPEDLDRIEWYEDAALIEVPVSALERLPFKNDWRENDPRLKSIMRAIRAEGYNNLVPIRVRIGRRGRWVVVDGGHRLTAIRKLMRSFWTRLFGPRIRSVSMLVFKTPLSNTLPPHDIEPPDEHDEEAEVENEQIRSADVSAWTRPVSIARADDGAGRTGIVEARVRCPMQPAVSRLAIAAPAIASVRSRTSKDTAPVAPPRPSFA